MFGATYTSTRGVLSPSKALRLFKLYMEDTHRIDNDHDVLMELCLDADFALSRIQQSEKKRIASSASNEDKVLCRSIASAYYEITRLFERLGRMNDAQKSDRKAEKWGYIQGSNPISNNNSCGQEYSDISISKMKGLIKVVSTSAIHNIAIIPTGVFDHDVAQVGFKCNLPHPDARLNDTQQLAYCLSLLPTAPQPLKGLTAQEQEWSLARSDDLTEQDRLHSLASDVITMFIHEGIKTEATVAEVVMLAPVLNYDQYRALLMALVNGINQNIMLETHLLQGLAQLMQHVPLGYLDSDDLVNTLNMLDSHLRGTHGQSSDHIYRLCVSVSHVLDAMVNSQVKGLKRGQLHEPLAAYLKGLKNSSDPHLVYHAAYASQALLYIPNDETTMQSMLRRTSAVARGVFGVVSAVKGLDLNAFMDELADIQKKLPSVEDAIGMSRSVCSGVISLYKSGAAFRQSMEEGFSFDSKTAWYPALRGTDTFLQSGELTKFKALACKAPCRQDLAFQWGLCQRLARIAVNSEWAVEVRKDAVSFLGEIYKNDKDWGHHVAVKQWILTILKGLTSLPKEELQGEQARYHILVRLCEEKVLIAYYML
ncbi:hypothetical protein BX616_009717 [Lobosporangium transversale]|nr:hypothetical protein BX616_009717 [Lobosporangium transversale]